LWIQNQKLLLVGKTVFVGTKFCYSTTKSHFQREISFHLIQQQQQQRQQQQQQQQRQQQIHSVNPPTTRPFWLAGHGPSIGSIRGFTKKSIYISANRRHHANTPLHHMPLIGSICGFSTKQSIHQTIYLCESTNR
jgi:hypothetical protein